jgi:hypothetical protein
MLGGGGQELFEVYYDESIDHKEDESEEEHSYHARFTDHQVHFDIEPEEKESGEEQSYHARFTNHRVHFDIVTEEKECKVAFVYDRPWNIKEDIWSSNRTDKIIIKI